jgi:hypothetical protein
MATTGLEVWAWKTHTDPFWDLKVPTEQACFVVEQVSDVTFQIPDGCGFQYTPADGSDPIDVDRSTLPDTDFASIPRYMSWFVSRHGRHTPAALLHDRLVTDDMAFDDRKQADTRFLELMDRCGVPPVKAGVMWTAVTLATRWRGTAVSRAGLAAWGLVAVAGMAVLGLGLATLNPVLIVAALLAPAIASLLWGDQWRAGMIGGYALPIVAVPALASIVGDWVYWVIEMAVKLLRRDGRPGPSGYQGGPRRH